MERERKEIPTGTKIKIIGFHRIDARFFFVSAHLPSLGTVGEIPLIECIDLPGYFRGSSTIENCHCCQEDPKEHFHAAVKVEIL